MKEYTIEITNYCPHDCEYCSTNSTSCEGVFLDIEIIKEFLKDVTKYDRINISGGEPLAHPQFYEILCYCKSLSEDVWVYTNAIDKIRYNTDVVPEITVDANVCLMPGRQVYIPKNADTVHILQLVPQGRAKNMKPATIHVSGNLCDKCNYCHHLVLQADGKTAKGPCKKDYLSREEEKKNG